MNKINGYIKILGLAFSILTCLYVVSLASTDLFLYLVTLITITSIISLCLEVSLANGIKQMWFITGTVAFISWIISFFVDSIPLISFHCGPECGAGVRLKPLFLAVVILLGAIVHSIALFKLRRWLRVITVFLLVSLILSFGLSTWVV